MRYLGARLSLFLRMEFSLKMAKLTTVAYAKFTEQLKGADDEESTFRTLDEDFVEALRVGLQVLAAGQPGDHAADAASAHHQHAIARCNRSVP